MINFKGIATELKSIMSLIGGKNNTGFNIQLPDLSKTGIDELVKEVGQYNLEMATAKLVTGQVSDENIVAALSQKGYSESVIRNQIAIAKENTEKTKSIALTNQQTVATKLFTAAQKLATVAVSAFKAVLTTIAISAFISIVMNLVTAEKELAEATNQSSEELKTLKESISDYANRYEELHSALVKAKGDEEETYNIKSQILELQKELNDKYGDEYGKINLLSEGYKNLTNEIIKYGDEAEKAWLKDPENRKGYENAKKKLDKEKTFILGVGFNQYNNSIPEVNDLIEEIGLEVDDARLSISFTGDTKEAEEKIQEFFDKLYEFRSKYEKEGNDSAIKQIDEIISYTGKSLKSVQDDLEKYESSYITGDIGEIKSDKTLSKTFENLLELQENIRESMLKSEYDNVLDDPAVKELYDEYSKLRNEIRNDESWKDYLYTAEYTFDQLDTRILDFQNEFQNNNELKSLAENLKGLTDLDLESMYDDDNKDSFDLLIGYAEEYKITVDELIDELVRLGYVQSQISSDASQEKIEALPYDWETLDEQIDSIQSAYQAVQSAQEEYNQYGYVSLDTLQALISLDSEYLSCLIDENGQLQLNNAAYQSLVQAKLAEAEASAVSQAIEELNNLQKKESTQSSYDYVEANALLAESLATLSGSYGAVANSAAAAAQAQALSAALEGAKDRGVDQAEIENVMSNLNAKLQLIRSTSVSTAKSFGNMNNAMNGFKDSTDSATDALDEQKEALEKQKEALEKSKEALEDQKEELEEIKDDYDELYDAIQWYFDDQIDGFDDLIDNLNDVNDALQEQLDTLDDVLVVVNNVYNEEIDAIQAKIDALDEANDAAERELALEEAKQKLEEARNNRTILQYTEDRGYIYTVDEKAIKEAEDEVDEANAEKIKAELEEQIKLLEEMRDKWGEIPDAFEKAMQEMAAIDKFGPNYKDFILGSTEEDINDFQGEYTGIQSDMEENNNQIDYYEKQKEKIEELKELWEDAKNAYRDAQYEAKLSAFFGSDYEYQLLNNSTEWSQKFADNYSKVSAEIQGLEDAIDGIDDQIDAVNKQIEELEDKIEEIKNSAKGGGSGSGGSGGGAGSSGRGLSYYIWTEEDEYALITAKTRLDELNKKIEEGDTSLIGARDSVQEFITQYEGLKDTRTNIDNVNTSLSNLKSYGEGYFGTFDSVISGVSDRLGDSANYTNQIVDFTWTAKNYVQDLDSSIKSTASSTEEANNKVGSIVSGAGDVFLNASQKLDTLSSSMDNVETSKGALQSGISQVISDATSTITDVSQKANVAATNLQFVSAAMDDVTTGKEEIKSEVNNEIADVGTTITESVEKITLLKDALSGLDVAKQELETTVNSEILDSDTLITEAQTKVTDINNAVNQLISAIEQLKIKLNELYSTMSLLDEITLSNVISVIGFGDDESSLLGAIQLVINKIIGEEGLVYQLQALNENTDLSPIITQFNGEENSLLSSIQDVINIISVDGDSTCLITAINNITNTIQNITNVQNAFMNLETQVDGCITKVNELKDSINSLEDKTITVTTVFKSSGSAPTGFATGTAKSGKSFYKGSGNWGLPNDAPNSMVGEIGPEILLRDGNYKLIDKPQFIDLKKGDIIFNHEQTKAILKRGSNSNLKRLSDLGNNFMNKLIGKSFANGNAIIPYEYPEAFKNLYSSNLTNAINNLLPNNVQGFNSKIFDSIKGLKLTKDYNFGDIKINMYGVNDTNGFALEIKKNFNSILRQID